MIRTFFEEVLPLSMCVAIGAFVVAFVFSI